MASGKKDADEVRVHREMDAMKVVYAALAPLEPKAQRWVIDCVAERLEIKPKAGRSQAAEPENPREPDAVDDEGKKPAFENGNASSKNTNSVAQDTEVEGLSPVAVKWMRRSDLDVAKLSRLFSLGLDEIELIAKKVPGKNKKGRMKSVLLLTCVASYLSTGAPRAKHDAVKQACVHYDAYDMANFAAYIKTFSREVGGTKQSGYSLSAAGMTAATELVTSMVSSAG